MSRFLRVCLLVSVSVGCVGASIEAQKVRVTKDPLVVNGCKSLGIVRDESSVGGSDRAEDLLRQKTFNLGGNVVLVIGMDIEPGRTRNSYNIYAAGEAYRCETPQAPRREIPSARPR